MNEFKIKTQLGNLCVAVSGQSQLTPVVYLHGIFLDKELWKDVCLPFNERMQVFVDMPAHGKSDNVGFDWTLGDCAKVLVEILEELKIERCVAIGHSWGSMTALRAAVAYPNRFQALGLFNMPHRKPERSSRVGFSFLKAMTGFPRVFAAQAAKSLYSKEVLEKRPELKAQMIERLARRPQVEINRTINAVILHAEDASPIIQQVKVPALAIVGEKDSVGIPSGIETLTVPGGHISPHETEERTRAAIRRLIETCSK